MISKVIFCNSSIFHVVWRGMERRGNYTLVLNRIFVRNSEELSMSYSSERCKKKLRETLPNKNLLHGSGAWPGMTKDVKSTLMYMRFRN